MFLALFFVCCCYVVLLQKFSDNLQLRIMKRKGEEVPHCVVSCTKLLEREREREREREEWVARCTTHCFWQSSIFLLNSSWWKGAKKKACNPRERERNQSLGPKPSSLLHPPTDDNCQGGSEGGRKRGRDCGLSPFFFKCKLFPRNLLQKWEKVSHQTHSFFFFFK